VTALAPRVVHVEECMGTVFTIDIRDAGDWSAPIADVVRWLHHVDAVFSTYREGSDVMRIRRGELRVDQAEPEVAAVLDLCADVQLETGGAFTAMPGGVLDPTGLVKGWAIEQASSLLRELGSANHAVNGGGDMQLAGSAGPDRPWTVGITDPHDRTRVLTTVTCRDSAVATSATYERGAHIIDPFTSKPATRVASATVVGPSLTRADAYATAAFVMGRHAVPWCADLDGYEAMLVTPDGGIVATPRWAA
jgi:FAD:protein FMN transferase